MENNDLVSIIVPVYNTEKYIERCVSSLRSQTYTNIEIILVDDGSTDASPALCDKYAQSDSRIKSIHKKNGGVSSARNLGFENCSGDYISYVDSDDYVHPQFIEILYKGCRDSKSNISQCNSRFVKQNKKMGKQFVSSNNPIEIITWDTAVVRCVKGKYKLSYNISCTKMFSRELIQHIRYADMVNAEDVRFCHEAFFASDKVAIINLTLYYYCKRQGSATTSNVNLSTNIINAFDLYDDSCKHKILKKEILNKCLEGSYIYKMDSIVEDYWHAYLLKNDDRKRHIIYLFYEYINAYSDVGYNLTLKLKIFDLNPRLFILCRYLYRILFLC